MLLMLVVVGADRGGLLVSTALVAVAGADEASEEVEEAASDDGEIGASEHVKTVTLFPDYPDQKFTQGQLIDVLCGFSNTGDKSFNVTKLEGSLHSPMDYRYIQNFTERTPFTEIKEGGQGTLLFQFYSDPNLEPRDYVLTLSVDYVDAEREEYQTVYFNQTIEFVESQATKDSAKFFGYVLSLVLLAAAAFGAQMLHKRFAGKKGKAPVVPVARTSGGANEWLQDTMLAGKKGSKKA